MQYLRDFAIIRFSELYWLTNLSLHKLSHHLSNKIKSNELLISIQIFFFLGGVVTKINSHKNSYPKGTSIKLQYLKLDWKQYLISKVWKVVMRMLRKIRCQKPFIKLYSAIIENEIRNAKKRDNSQINVFTDAWLYCAWCFEMLNCVYNVMGGSIDMLK